MRPAFSTLGCPGQDLAGAVALARSHGMKALEIRALGGTVDLPAYFADTFGTPDRLAEAARQLDFPIAALGTSLRLIGGTADGRDWLLRYVPWALALGAPYLRVFDGGVTADETELAAADATLAWWDACRSEHGWPLDLIVETHDALVHPAALRRFIARQPGRLLLWDAHHTWRRGGEDPVDTWELVRRATVHIHLKDSVGTPGHHDDHSYVALGEGEFPVARLLQALRASRFDGVVSLEWERMWHPDLAPLEDVLPAYAALFA